jgi:hypothetical protein
MNEESERTWDEAVVEFDLNEWEKSQKPKTVDAWAEIWNRAPHSTGGSFLSWTNLLGEIFPSLCSEFYVAFVSVIILSYMNANTCIIPYAT